MDPIAALEARIGEVEKLLSDAKSSTEVSRLSAGSLKHHLDELLASLRLEKQRRLCEVLELRLDGYDTQNGTIPLSLLGKLAKNLSDSLHSSARYLQYGTQGGAVPRQITDLLNLRLSAIASGSTRLIITGDTSPDLFGRSLTEEGLRSTFALLRSTSQEELVNAVARIGTKSAASIRKVLAALADENITLEMRWVGPDEKETSFEGTPVTMRELAVSLGGFEPGDEVYLKLSGEIVTLSSREKFEMKSDGDELVHAVVPAALLGKIKTLHVGQRVVTKLRRTTVVNRITQAEKGYITLVDVAPDDRPEPVLPF